MNPILFLDVDGVINSAHYLLSYRLDVGEPSAQERAKRAPRGSESICPTLLGRVDRIVRETGCDVVVSSAWRHGRNTHDLTALFRARGATFRVRSSTPLDRWILTAEEIAAGRTVTEETRGDQIQAWLDVHGGAGKGARWGGWHAPIVLLDDTSDMAHLTPYLVLTDHRVGITDADADRAIAMLRADVDALAEVPRG